jgi:hypothetical protein
MSRSSESNHGPRSQPDQTPLPYYRAARFRAELPSARAYSQAQSLIYEHKDNDLSVFRFHIERTWCVTVLGEQPSPELQEQIARILRPGQRVDLPPELLQFLLQRRIEAAKQGDWV